MVAVVFAPCKYCRCRIYVCLWNLIIIIKYVLYFRTQAPVYGLFRSPRNIFCPDVTNSFCALIRLPWRQ